MAAVKTSRLALAVALVATLLLGCAPPAQRVASDAPPETPAPLTPTAVATLVASVAAERQDAPAPPPTGEPAPARAPVSPTPAGGEASAPTPTVAQATPTPASRDDLDRVVEKAVAEGYFPGAALAVSRDGKVVKQAAYGSARLYSAPRTRVADPIPVRPDTIFDLASLTKLFTATYVMQLVEAGRIDLDRTVASYLPAFGANGKDRITVRQLLDHSSGLPAGMALEKIPGSIADRLAAVDAVKLKTAPGTAHVYSDLNYIVLGQLVELLSGQSLAEYGRTHVFEPLGMRDTTYNPPASLRERIAATEYEPAAGRGMVWGEVHDESAFALGGAAGHAGLFSTTADLVRFGEAMLGGGALGDARILRPETVRAMTTVGPGDAGHGLGWEVDQDWYMGPLASARAWGHTGYTGTSIVVDASRHLVVVLLTNRVHPTRDGPSINSVRQSVAAAALRLYGGGGR